MLNKVQAGFVADMKRATLQDLKNMILPGKFESNELMQVYRNNYYISLTEALRSVYVSVDKLVGKGFFDFVAHSYIDAHPSKSGNLHEFGSYFSYFIGSLDQAASVPYIADIAKLDWAWHQMFHAKDSAPLNVETLEEFEHEELGALNFKFIEGMQVLTMGFTVFGLWNHCREIPGFEGADELSYNKTTEFIMIHRLGLDVVVSLMSQAEVTFIEELKKGECLADATESAMSHNMQFQLLEVLQSLFVKEVIDRVELLPEN